MWYMIYVSVHLTVIYTLTFSNVLLALALNLMVHKSSYCKCILVWCQLRTFCYLQSEHIHSKWENTPSDMQVLTETKKNLTIVIYYFKQQKHFRNIVVNVFELKPLWPNWQVIRTNTKQVKNSQLCIFWIETILMEWFSIDWPIFRYNMNICYKLTQPSIMCIICYCYSIFKYLIGH